MSRPGKFQTILPKPVQFRPPPGPPNDSGERKRKRADLACQNCRMRKIKCDTKRPSCSTCSSGSLVCEYKSNATREDLEKQIRDHEKSIQGLEATLDVFRRGSAADCAAALQRIRVMGNTKGAASSIFDAQLLLFGAGSIDSRKTEPPYGDRNPKAADRLLGSPLGTIHCGTHCVEEPRQQQLELDDPNPAKAQRITDEVVRSLLA